MDFKETRQALSAVFNQHLIIRAFDVVQDKLFKRYHISNKQTKILSGEKKQEPLPALQAPLESKQKTIWEKKDNFDDTFSLGSDILLNRSVSYHCQLPSSKFKAIKISGYKDNTVTVFLSILSPFYPAISALLKKMGFSKIDYIASDPNEYQINIYNLSFLASLLSAITQIEPTVTEIHNNILCAVKPYLKEQFPFVPGWIKSGDFQPIRKDLKTCLIYTSIQPVNIKKVSLLKYKDDSLGLTIHVEKQTYEAFKTIL